MKAAVGPPQTIDDYLAEFPRDARSVLERVRRIIRRAVPGAEESISYRIPTFKLHGRPVIYFAGYKGHYSIYPSTARVVAALGEQLAGRQASKATIRFSFTEDVPAKLIEGIAKVRAEEVVEAHAARTKRR